MSGSLEARLVTNDGLVGAAEGLEAMVVGHVGVGAVASITVSAERRVMWTWHWLGSGKLSPDEEGGAEAISTNGEGKVGADTDGLVKAGVGVPGDVIIITSGVGMGEAAEASGDGDGKEEKGIDEYTEEEEDDSWF